MCMRDCMLYFVYIYFADDPRLLKLKYLHRPYFHVILVMVTPVSVCVVWQQRFFPIIFFFLVSFRFVS